MTGEDMGRLGEPNTLAGHVKSQNNIGVCIGRCMKVNEEKSVYYDRDLSGGPSSLPTSARKWRSDGW